MVISSGGYVSLSVGKSLLVSVCEVVCLFVCKVGMKLVVVVCDIDVFVFVVSVNIFVCLNIM